MEGATLTIALRDESNQGQGSPANPPPGSGGQQAPSHVSEQQQSITAAGGVGQLAESRYRTAPTTTSSTSASEPIAQATSVPVAAATPTPVVTTTQATADSALAASVQRIVQADPRATAEEIAKLLGGGMGARQVEALMRPQEPTSGPTEASTTPIATSAAPPIAEPDDVQMLIRRERRRKAEFEDEERLKQEEIKKKRKDDDDEIQTLIRRSHRQAAEFRDEERRKTEHQEESASKAQFVVNAISHFAHAGGPLGSAVAGAANTAMLMPGVSQLVGSAMPALAVAGPPAIAAAAGLAGIGAAVSLANNEANRAIAISRQYSAETVGAEAQADVRQIMADIRTSRRLGDESAAIIDATSRRNVALQGIRDVFAEPILRDWAKFNESIANAAELVNKLTGDPKTSGAVGRAATDIGGTATFGINYWIYRALGEFFGWAGKPNMSNQGIMGVVPEELPLPIPFTNKQNNPPPNRGTIPGIPTFIISPLSGGSGGFF